MFSSISVALDTIGLITTSVYIVSNGYPTWLVVILVILFALESVFKIASIFHARNLYKFLVNFEHNLGDTVPL